METREKEMAKFPNFIVTTVFGPLKMETEKCHSPGKTHSLSTPPHRLFIQTDDVYWSAWIRMWSQHHFQCWGLTRGNHQSLFSVPLVAKFWYPSSVCELHNCQDILLISIDLQTTVICLKLGLFRVTVLPETKNPDTFKPMHFVWVFQHRTVSAIGFFWVLTQLQNRHHDLTQPCMHTLYCILPDCL